MANKKKANGNVQQTRDHSGHSHNHDNSFLTSTNKTDPGVRITRIGLYVNLGMAIVKGVGGYYFNSKALLADALHSLTDLISDFMTLATVSWSQKPPTARFPAAYGKIESLGALGVSGILLTTGFLMGWAAIFDLCQQFIPGFANLLDQVGVTHGHSHDHSDLGPNINAAWLAAGSILIKEWLYRATNKIAIERKSAVLASNAYHHRVDSLTAFVALLMIAGSNVFHNAAWLDPSGGLVISFMIIQAGLGNTKTALLELADVTLDTDVKASVRRAALSAIADLAARDFTTTVGRTPVTRGIGAAEAITLRTVQGIKAGQSLLLELELGVPDAWSVSEARHVEQAVRTRVGERVRGAKRVKVRFVPLEGAPVSRLEDEFVDPSTAGKDVAEEEHPHRH